jgi:DNA primase
MARDTVSEIKARLSIQDVVAPYVKLRKAGRSLTGLCPFHKEKTPSFHVSLERGSYHCFGCGEGGDMFSFVQKVEGVDFKASLQMLADKAGVEIVYDPAHKERAGKLERLREAVNRAQQWYAGKLEGSVAEKYAKERGLTKETIKSWGLGYAPDGWRNLLEALAAEGFSTEELLAAGLIKEADGKRGTYYDRFRNRLMFPLRDASGRAVGFTGRILPTPPQGYGEKGNNYAIGQEQEPAKYLNSPETELYHKSEMLFGMDKAKDAIRLRKFTMLVEGQMDVLHCHQAGFENAIALSGTALTAQHLTLMKRYSENLMLVLDADAAGLSATAKSAALALREGLRVKAAKLSGGKDPADLISEDPKAFATCVKDAKPIVEFFLAALSEREKDSHRLLRLAESVVLPLLAAIPSPMEREHFAGLTARALGLSSEAVRESLSRLPKQAADAPAAPRMTVPAAQAVSARERRANQLLSVMAAYPDTPLAKRIGERYLLITEADALPQSELPQSDLFAVEQQFGEEPSEDAADELLRAFEEAVIREAYQEAVGDLRRAESAGDAESIAVAHKACAALSSRLSRIGSS